MFSKEQDALLAAPLSSSNVKKREGKYSYIEGWHAIAEANRIFGYGNWSRETVELRCIAEREREIGQYKTPGWGVTYISRVRVKAWGEDGNPVIREGAGSGHGIDKDLGQAHESALKEAETDAMKRALMTFGNPFGLALYDKEQAGVETAAPAPKPSSPPAEAQRVAAAPKITPETWAKDAIAHVKRLSQVDLDEWSDKNNAAMVKLRASAPNSHKQLMDAIRDRYAVLEPMGAG